MADRTTIWAPLGLDHPLLAAAGFTGPAQVPLFVDGQAFREFEKTRRVAITPAVLLFGAILHAREDPPAVDAGPFRDRVRDLLAELARGFQAASLEELLLGATADLRRKHGSALSRRALENAVALFPSFQRARSDLVADLWVEAGRASGPDRAGLLRSLVQEFGLLDRRPLNAGPRAFVCYAAVAATAATEGSKRGRELFLDLAGEIDAGDEGSLRKNLDRFLGGEAADWSLLEVPLE
jgi:hypothetical protein